MIKPILISAGLVLGGQYLDWVYGLRVGVFSTLVTILLWAYKLSQAERPPAPPPPPPVPRGEEWGAPGWAARWK